jgi:FlaA1/EpsC-like NDP-sugar epimerase
MEISRVKFNKIYKKENLKMNKNYVKFFGMIATAAVFMFMVMYLNTYEFSHIFFSEERLYMTILSTCMMAIIMLSFMLHMLKNKNMNIAIVVISVLIFASSLYLMRDQTTVDDVDYMEGMIPHHSIAILTSERANISDPRVRELADGIIDAQVREIREMKNLIEDIKNED